MGNALPGGREQYVIEPMIYTSTDADRPHSFGFRDGISNPSVIGFDRKPRPGEPAAIEPGVLLAGHEGDPEKNRRPAWAVDGSFLVFRYLSQLVPEFNTFLKKNPVQLDGMSPEQGSEFLGARMVGRWKSGKSHLLTVVRRPTTNGARLSRSSFRSGPEGGSTRLGRQSEIQ